MKYQTIDINTHILSVNLMLYLIHDNGFLQSQSDHHPLKYINIRLYSSGILVVHFEKHLLLWFTKVEFLTLSNNFLYSCSLDSMGTIAKLFSLNNKVPTPLRWRSVINCSLNLDEFSDLMAAISLCGDLSSPSKTFSFASITSFVAERKK